MSPCELVFLQAFYFTAFQFQPNSNEARILTKLYKPSPIRTGLASRVNGSESCEHSQIPYSRFLGTAEREHLIKLGSVDEAPQLDVFDFKILGMR